MFNGWCKNLDPFKDRASANQEAQKSWAEFGFRIEVRSNNFGHRITIRVDPKQHFTIPEVWGQKAA